MLSGFLFRFEIKRFKMDSQELLNKIKTGKCEFDSLSISENLELFHQDIERFDNLIFKNCCFKEVAIYEINHPFLTIKFHNCTFDGDTQIIRCSIHDLQFSSLEKIKKISINYGKFDTIRINSSTAIDGDIDINQVIINNNLDCSNLFLKKGQFTLNLRDKIKEATFNTSFNNSIINILNFSSCKFGEKVNFKNLKLILTTVFDSCEFENINFQEADFGQDCLFNNCLFEKNTSFQNSKNIINTHLIIKNCLFLSSPHFNESEINQLEISNTVFEKKASFDSVKVNTINFNQVTFTQGAYFDDIQIIKINNCNRKTIRLIKQELQKAENRIDFNRFRAYELAAHYKELDWKWNSGFIDKSILFLNKISTDFGNSWRRAFMFTIITGFVIYLILYTIENRGFQINVTNCDNWARLFSGFFRFLLVTDFFNPLDNDRTYLTNPFSWLIFIFGKIVIAFGIYEMIQSFRKFKA